MAIGIYGYPSNPSSGGSGGNTYYAGAGLTATTNPDGTITLSASGSFLTWYYEPSIPNSRYPVAGNNVTLSTAIDGQLVISAAATGGGAPTVSSYIVGTTEPSLPNSSVATEGNGITIAVTPGGAATFGISSAITGADILTWQPGDTIFTDRRALVLGSGLSAAYGTNTLTLSVTGQNAGTVTSVGLSTPSWLTVGSSPVTTAGTISLTATNQAANTLLMGPSGGADAASAFRKLLGVDLPISAGSNIVLSTDATGGLNIASTGGGGSGTVTSVGLTAPNIFAVTGSPVTTSGTLDLALESQAQNTFLASPSGGAGTPFFRIITRNDLPITPGSNVTFSLNSSGGLAINASVSGGGGGSVTSVDSTTPTSLFTVSGNPITLSGTLAYALTNAASSKVWAGPVSGADATPTYRSLVAGDIPTLPFTKISGTIPVGQGGTNLTATPTNGQLPIGNGTDYTLATITPGTGVQVSNGSGTITVSATGALGGTVTSVAQSVPASLLSISGTPITTAGTLAIGLTNAASGQFWAGPTSGAATTPAYRALVAADIPSGIDATKIADGSVTSTEFQYINTLTSNAQTQIDGKAANSEAFVTLGNTSGLTNERSLAVAGGLTIQDLGAGNAVTISSSALQPLDATLTALAAYNTTGFITQTGVDTFAGRTLAAAGGLTIQESGSVITVSGSAINGTVTSFSAGDLSPLFTTTESTVTTTPALSFAAVNQASGGLAYLSPASGSAAAPSFRTIGGSDLAAGIVAGSNITITQLPGTNQMSIASTASGGSGGGLTLSTISTNATAAISTCVLVNLSSSNVTLALPTPVGQGGKDILVKVISNTVPPNTLVINCTATNGAALVDGSSSTITTQYVYDAFRFVSDNGNNWYNFL